MFDINTKVQWRTGGRGVFRILKGTVISIIKAGKLPIKSMQDKVPHGDKPSNRDRYIVEVKDGIFCWANIKTCWKQGEKLPPAKHRFGVKSKPKGKAKVKKALKVKSIKAKLRKSERVQARKKMTPAAKVKAGSDPVEKPVAKKSGGDKPKTTWYGIVDGKVVSVRKVVCPEGYTKDKPTPQVTPQAAPQVTPQVTPQVAAEAPAAPAPAAAASTLPTA